MDALFTSDKMIHNNTDGSESDGLGRLDQSKLSAIRGKVLEIIKVV